MGCYFFIYEGFAMHYFFFIILCSFLLPSCSDDGTTPTDNAKKDSIETVTIGNQVWMARNLDVAIFQNGDTIQEVKTIQDLDSVDQLDKPAWCYYNFDPENGKIYGRLYNGHAVNDPRKIAPIGFHIANDDEWTQLTTFLGTDSAGAKMKSTTGWSENGNGTNLSGFNALPGGACGNELGGWYFSGIGGFGFWWCSPNSNNQKWGRDIYNRRPRVGRFLDSEEFFYSVRCIKD
jgi:uncharacterized protein (TIGR02145 family)